MNGRVTRQRIDRQITAALRRVYDPCSVAQSLPVSIYDLGLVTDWTLDTNGHLDVRMCVTAPMCLMARSFLDAAKQELESLPEVTSARCYVDATTMWTPQDMSVDAVEFIRARRARSMRELPVRPRQWLEPPRAVDATS
jgi:metal-sulfur cluster biosynthetic enzyme